MSQTFLESVLPEIAPVFAALAPDPRIGVKVQKLTPFFAPEIVVSRAGRPWRRLVDKTLPLGADDLYRLERSTEAMTEASIHSIVRLPGAWCALGTDGLSPALLPHDGIPRQNRTYGPLLRQAIRQDVRCAFLGGKIPETLLNALPAHRRLALENDRQRLLSTAPPAPEPILVWSDGVRALSLSANVIETQPAKIVPFHVLAVAILTPPPSARSAPPNLAGALRASSRRIPR